MYAKNTVNTVNSKWDKQVNIIQKWNGNAPAINYLLRDFRRYLIQQKINSRLEVVKRQRRHFTDRSNADIIHYANSHTILWIETLLQTPLSDHRKYCIWRILSPYLLNVKKLSNEEAYSIMITWLDKCEAVAIAVYYCRLHPDTENAYLESIEHHCKYKEPNVHKSEILRLLSTKATKEES